MPLKAVADAVENRLTSNWTATPVIPYDTQPEPPSDVEGFVVVQYPVVNGVRPGLGRTFWEEGVIRIILNVVRGIGSAQALTWSGELAYMFRAVKFDGVETFMPDGPVIDDTIEEGNWVMYSISIPYRYEFVSAVYEPVSV
jgi:Bacteriophage related domain of unknown function